MIRTAGCLLLLFICFLFLSCAPSGSTQQQEIPSGENQQYPEWFLTETLETDDSISGYGTALADDSSTAGEKAADRAKRNLGMYIAEVMEQIRSEASAELGSDSGVDSPKFILALRKAEKAASDASVESEVATEPVSGFQGYRGFSEVTVSKQLLLKQMDTQLSAHESAWNAIKESRAFEDFLADDFRS